MLRASVEATGCRIDLQAVVDRSADPLLPGAAVLLDLVDASVGSGDLGAARTAVLAELGVAALVDAAAVQANFEMMNRIADGTGIPVGKGSRARHADLVEMLELDRFGQT
jgi:hypothetical protein